jgi:hypothetical protein
LNRYRLQRRFAATLVIVAGLLLLCGCQGLGGSSNNSSGNTVAVTNPTLSFGDVPMGGSKTLSDTLTNNSSASVTISSIQGATSGFVVTGITLPLILAPAQSAPFSVQFKPTAAGDPTITISFMGSNSQAYASLSATATSVTGGQLSPSPSPVAFTDTKVGGSQTTTVSLANSGGMDLTITQATLSGAGFSMGNLALPLTVQAGKASSATLTFAPPGAGNFNGSVTFAVTSNQQNSTVVLNLSGTGVVSGTLSPSPSSFAFGSVQTNTTSSKSETLTNAGTASLTITQVTPSGAGFSVSGLSLPVTLTANQTVTFSTVFAPTSAGAVTGALTIASNASNATLSIPLTGTGATPGVLTANPTSLGFGSHAVGNTTNLSEVLTNTGGMPVTISQANLTGAAFSDSGLTLPLTLTTNQSVTFTTTFTPTSAGAVTGNIAVVSNASNSSLSIGLSGTGTASGQLAVSPASLGFGSVAVGSSSPLSGSLNATGAAVTVTAATLANSEFVLSGISLPVTIAAGQSAPFSVTFTPQASGATSATLSFTSNASNSPAAQTMTGTGTAATQHTVDLTWTAATGAVGYNVYRGTVSGGPYTKINSSLDGTTAYADNTVVSGHTYYYVATTVDGSSNESGHSNEAQAVVPTP